jgi:hypothetical protein
MTEMRPPSLWFDDALMLLTLRLEHEVALTRLLRGEGRQEGFLGLFVSDDEAQAIIAELAGTRSVSGAALNDARLAAMWAQASAARLSDPRGIWARYVATLGLTEAELDLILIASAPALDPRFGRVYGYLNDDMARRYLTPALARTLLDRHALSVRDVRAMLAPDAPLRAYGLLDLGDGPFADAPVRMPEDALNEILDDAPPPPTTFAVTQTHPIETHGHLRVALGDDPAFWAAQIAAQSRQDLMLYQLPKNGAPIAPALRQAALANAVPLILGADDLTPEAATRFVTNAAPHRFCLATQQPDNWAERGLICATPHTALPVLSDRLQCITPALANHPADIDPLLQRLRASGKLQITTLLSVLERYRDTSSVTAALTRALDGALDRLARRVTTKFTRDDLVLPRATRTALETVISWRAHAPDVLDTWALGETFGKSRALTALFKGPSGTGKTMAASVIANTLNLPLYKVDLATLVSKYIGETERNLDQLFSAAEAADVVLFFDECDAIFGKRSEVNDAHDRYANLETSFLLQRMEQFAGLMILASNLHKNMDDAFLRRFDLVADFPAPGPRERKALWARLHHTRAPLSDDIDFTFLAETFDLTGGEIRNCCLDAAHSAAANSGQIDMACLVKAVAREQLKQGRTVHRASFGIWESAL